MMLASKDFSVCACIWSGPPDCSGSSAGHLPSGQPSLKVGSWRRRQPQGDPVADVRQDSPPSNTRTEYVRPPAALLFDLIGKLRGWSVCVKEFVPVLRSSSLWLPPTQQSNTWSHFCRELQKQQRLGGSQWFHCSSRKRPQSGRGSGRNTTKQSRTLRDRRTPPQQLKPKALEQGLPCQERGRGFFQMVLLMCQHEFL